MAKKDVFARVELKFKLDYDQYVRFMEEISSFMMEDEFGEATICNIYYDTPGYRLIRKSLEKPKYKEKLRLRTYVTPNDDTEAFIEIKKKFYGVVYKRRVSLPYGVALETLSTGEKVEFGTPKETQISEEIYSFLSHYKDLLPAMSIFYDRIALVGRYDKSLRITLDSNIRYRTDHLDLRNGTAGRAILENGERLLEVKVSGGMPMQLVKILSELQIYKTSFSKYGTAYRMMISERMKPAAKKSAKKKYAETASKDAAAYAS